MKMKRLTALFISLFILLNLTGDLSVFAESNTKVYKYDGYDVYYTITNEWSNNQNITIKIKNIGKNAIENWAVEFDAGGEISGLWNAQVYNQTNTNYILKNSEYNHCIKIGQFVEFGYTVSGDSVKTPEKILICSKKVDITGECDVYYNILNDYGDSYQAEIVIINNTDNVIESWELVSDTTANINNVWNAEISNKSENSCIFVSDSNTYRIEAESKISFNVSGKKGKNDVVSFDNFRLYTVEVTSSNNDYTYTPWLPDGIDILIACAEYEDETLFFEWTYGSNDGTFTIYENTNNGKEKVAEISRGRTYEYHIGKITGSREFFIETTDNGKTVISNPINIYIDDEEYVQVDYPDTDGDGIADVFEHIYGTDPNKYDTDSDGLNDYEELYLFGTDPLLADCDGDSLPDGFEVFQTGTDPLNTNSLGNDKTDGEYDMDDDGLTNYQEFIYNTNPMNADSDNDGLNDYEEIFTYKTNPSIIDTDGDNVSDGDEISLNLNPNNPQTYGYPDSEFTVVQKLDENSESLSEINSTKNNPFSISVEMDCAGKIENNLTACESGYAEIINNESIVGIVPEIIYPDDLDINEFKLTFKLDNNAVINTNDCHNDEDTEFDGIERFTVFKMFEDYNMLLPIETNYDTNNNEVYVNTDEAGTYCLVDMELWINMLENQTKNYTGYYDEINSEEKNIELFSENLENMTMHYDSSKIASNKTVNKSSSYEYTIIFIYDESNMEYKNYKDGFVDLVNGGNKDAEINDSEAVMTTDNYFDITESLKEIKDNENIYCFVMFDNDTAKFNKNSGYALINELNAQNINVSLISNPIKQNNYDYGMSLTKETGGIFINTNLTYEKDDDIPNKMYNHIFGNDYKGTEYNVILIDPLSYSTIKLRKPITDKYFEYANNYTFNSYDRIKNTENMVDSDGDNLYDFEEIRFFWDKEKNDPAITLENDEVKFPSLADISVKLKEEYDYIKDFSNNLDNLISEKDINVEVLPILSHPMREDGDGDGITDYNERVAIEEYNEYEKYLANHSKSKTRQYYKCSLDPIKKDTIETIIEKIKISKSSTMLMVGDKSGVNKNSFDKTPVIIKVNNNDVYIHANVNFNFEMSLNDNIETTKKIKTKVINSIEEAWTGEFYGNKFDFYPGIKINVKTKLHNFDKARSYININFYETCGRSTSTLKFLSEMGINKQYPYINLYAFYCKDSYKSTAAKCSTQKCNHFEDSMQKKCFECHSNAEVSFLIKVDNDGKYDGFGDRFEKIAAHEFGHSLGLTDAYESEKTGQIKLPYETAQSVKKEEIFTCRVYYKSLEVLNSDIMGSNLGSDMLVNSNDIEMVLIGFAKQTTQGFINSTEEYNYKNVYMSPAIRTPYLVLSGKNKGKTYITYLSMNAFDNTYNKIMTEPYSESKIKDYEKDIDKKISDNGYDMFYQALKLN